MFVRKKLQNVITVHFGSSPTYYFISLHSSFSVILHTIKDRVELNMTFNYDRFIFYEIYDFFYNHNSILNHHTRS